MTYIYILYGAAFLSLGLTVAVYPRQRTALRLSKHLPLLIAFGLLHGANEWIDLARLLEGDLHALVIARSILLPASLFFLLLFGARAFGASSPRGAWWRSLPWGLLALAAIATGASSDHVNAIDTTSRYFLAIPGAALAALALASERRSIARYDKKKAVQRWLLPAVIGFACYGFFAGVIARPGPIFPANLINAELFRDWVGAPVEAFRAGAACLVTYGVIGLLSVFRWHQEHRLYESEERYRGLVQLAPLGVITAVDGRVSFANSRAAEIAGASDITDLVGSVLLDLVHEDSREHVAKLVGEIALGKREHFADDERLRRLDGSDVPVLLAAAPLTIGSWRGLQVVFQDITTLKQQETELARHRDRLDDLVRERTADLESALEDLKTALAQVQTLSGLLPICAWCKRIRDDDGYWAQIESYVSAHSDAQFTHGICPDCTHKLTPATKTSKKA